MPKPYPVEFRDEVVREARGRGPGVTIEQVAKGFGVHPVTLQKWMRRDGGVTQPPRASQPASSHIDVTDDRLSKLRGLEVTVLDSIELAPAERRAPLVAQYRAILAEIAELDGAAGKVSDPIDEIAARRSARGGASARKRRAVANKGELLGGRG